MPRVATVPGICCSDIKALSIASASTDSRATQKSPGRIVTRQEGDLAATDSTAAAVDIDVGSPWPEINRLVHRLPADAYQHLSRSVMSSIRLSPPAFPMRA